MQWQIPFLLIFSEIHFSSRPQDRLGYRKSVQTRHLSILVEFALLHQCQPQGSDFCILDFLCEIFTRDGEL